jgi:hypothetical protein
LPVGVSPSRVGLSVARVEPDGLAKVGNGAVVVAPDSVRADAVGAQDRNISARTAARPPRGPTSTGKGYGLDAYGGELLCRLRGRRSRVRRAGGLLRGKSWARTKANLGQVRK